MCSVHRQTLFNTYVQSWDILFSGYLVSLPGFLPGAVNIVQIANPTAFAPDFYRLGVAM